jgi:hypothetical protein
MKIRQVIKEAAGVTAAFAFGRFNPAHQGHIAVWQTVERAGVKWYIGTNPTTIGANDPLTFEQKSAWMQAIYPQITGHIVPETSVMTLAARIFKELGNKEDATVAYITDADDWAWSGKLLNQYNGVEGKHGYYKFAQIVHVPSPRVSSATALRDAARADSKVAFYQASGTDPKLKVAGKTYFDTVKEAVTKYPLPVKKAKKTQGVAEGDRPGMKDGRPYSDPLRRHPGNDSYMTPEYLIQKYQDELKKIAAGPYKRPKDVAMYKARIAKLQRQQGVAEGLNEDEYDKYEAGVMDESEAVAKMFTRLARQGRDPLDIIANRFGWGTYELDDLAQEHGFEDSAEWLNSFEQGVAEAELDEAKEKAKRTEEDIFHKGKKVGSITTTTTPSGMTFYTAQVGNSFVAGSDTREESLKHLKRLYRDYYKKKSVSEGKEEKITSLEKKIAAKQDALGLARERRRMQGQRQQGQREIKLQRDIDDLNSQIAELKKVVSEGTFTPMELAVMEGGHSLPEAEKIAGRYDPADFDSMVQRLSKIAKAGPMKTIWDPEKRVYKTVPDTGKQKKIAEAVVKVVEVIKQRKGLWKK